MPGPSHMLPTNVPRRRVCLLIAALVLSSSGAIMPVAAIAKTKPKSYRNCRALNRDYPHGVGRKGARDKTSSGKPVTRFKTSTKLYAYNDGRGRRHSPERDLDRDNDGIACEKL